MSFTNSDKDTRTSVHVLTVLFGISSSIVITGIFTELPYLVETLPEGWNLPSYLTIVADAANIGPMIYGILHRFYPWFVHETSAIVLIITVGTASCLLLVFTWDVTTIICGDSHSVALLVLVFFISISDCTTSVVYAPFVGFFKEKYLISLFIGAGFSGLLPGVVTLAQGIGRTSRCENVTTDNGSSYATVVVNSPPLFDVDVFFGFLCLMLVVSFVAFLLLRFLPSIETERSFISSNKGRNSEIDVNEEKSNRSSSNESLGNSSDEQLEKEIGNKSTKPLATSTFVYLLIVNFWISFLILGVVPSILSYICLPYGNLVYQLVVSVSTVVSTLVCFSTFYLGTRKTSVLTVMAIIASILSFYLISLAFLSPNPPFVGTFYGQALVIIVGMSFAGAASYTKTSLAIVLRTKGVRALFWYGAVSQSGATVGAVSMFIAVNVCHTFKSYNPCQEMQQ